MKLIPAVAGAAPPVFHHRSALLVQADALLGTEGGADAAFLAPGPEDIDDVLLSGLGLWRLDLLGGGQVSRSNPGGSGIQVGQASESYLSLTSRTI